MGDELEVKVDLVEETFSIGENTAKLVPLRAECREVTVMPKGYEGQGHTISIKYIDGRGKTEHELVNAWEKDVISINKILESRTYLYPRKEQHDAPCGLGFDSILDIEINCRAKINIASGYKERD